MTAVTAVVEDSQSYSHLLVDKVVAGFVVVDTLLADSL